MHSIGTNLFEFNGKQLFTMVDYYSHIIGYDVSSASCIDATKSVFSEFGYPQHIHSNSGRQYFFQEFNSFVHEFNVKHTISNAECYVGIVKRMLKKCDNIYDAFLAYRFTPLYNSRHNPYEPLFNRMMKDNVISFTHPEPSQQKTTQVNSEVDMQKPPQGNSELVMQKPICELLPP